MYSFSEQQRFRQRWIWPVLAFAVISAIYKHSHRLTNHRGDISMWIGVCAIVLVIVLFLFAKLETRINESGVYYRFVPFHFSERHLEWGSIKNAYVRKYNPIREYGGWGIRLGLFGRGTALNVQGHMGLQLEMKNGRKLLLGTQKPDELKQLLSGLVALGILNKEATEPGH